MDIKGYFQNCSKTFPMRPCKFLNILHCDSNGDTNFMIVKLTNSRYLLDFVILFQESICDIVAKSSTII